MARLVALALGCTSLAAVAAAAWHMGWIDKLTDQSNGAAEACEKLLIANLRSPSTYKRISRAFHLREPFSLDEFKRYSLTKYCGTGDVWQPCTETNKIYVSYGAKLLGDERGYGRPTAKQREDMRALYWANAYKSYQARPAERKLPATVIVTYDADNAYGTPVRNTEICNFGPRTGKAFGSGDMYESAVDGEVID